MELLRSEGFVVADVERRLPIPGMFITQDLFGFGDLLGVREFSQDDGFGWNVIVQVTTAKNMKARENKIKNTPAHRVWLSLPYNRIEVHGWIKIRGRWECRRKEIN